MAKKSTISAKERTSEKRDIRKIVGSLSQVIKVSDDVWGNVLSTGRTFEEHYSEMGFHRYTYTTKSGQTKKKGYTPGTLRAAVAKELLDGEKGYKYFKSVPVEYWEENDKYKVYDLKNAQKLVDYNNGVSKDSKIDELKVNKRVTIAEDKWKWDLIDKLLEQTDALNGGKKLHSLLEKEKKDAQTIKNMTEAYIVRHNVGKTPWEICKVSIAECIY